MNNNNEPIRADKRLSNRILVALLLVLVGRATQTTHAAADGPEGYFNGSAFAILKNTLDIRHVTSLGFRTCSHGLLFHQSGAGGDSLKLELTGSSGGAIPGRLRLQWKSSGRDGFVEFGRDFSDNRWHSVLLSYALGNITLTVDDRDVTLVANSTFNSELLQLDLLSPNPEVVVGQGYEGCLLQGAGLVFGESTVTSVGVNWTECPLPDRGDCDGFRVDYCFSQPCHKHGTCLPMTDGYQCFCTSRYDGRNCETDTGPLCEKAEFNHCENGGICQEDATGNTTSCACLPKFTGQFCETPIDARLCDSNPCQNNSTCHLNQYGDSFECNCLAGFAGLNCEVDIDECALSPCQHGGRCIDGINTHTCDCNGTGYSGDYCEINTDECLAESNPCVNGGRCFDTYGSYFCECRLGMSGKHCERKLDECSSAPCRNGATCIGLLNRYQCNCPVGFQGANCEKNIDDCVGVRCSTNARCIDGVNGYDCVCNEGFAGTSENCTNINECVLNPCSNGGTCHDEDGAYRCICPMGYTGTICSEDINECTSNPCNNGGTCVDAIGVFECRCPHGFEGPHCDVNVNECMSSPCLHGGHCEDGIGDYECHCSFGWSGKNCETDVDECLSAPCSNGATCLNSDGGFNCTCPLGFVGKLCETDVDDCVSSPCVNNGTCLDRVNAFECRCPPEFDGSTCSETYDDCTARPCRNGATCTTVKPQRHSSCACSSGFSGDRCEVNVDDCVGVFCELGFVCIDLIDTHECRCPVGFDGPSCEHQVDECLSGPCRNGGTCFDEVANYTCKCSVGYTGRNCDEDIDECAVLNRSPCVHGICSNRPGTYQCYCQPGFSGSNCDREYDECLSQPCRNGGSCQDLVNDYVCVCVPGYTGKECETDIDECSSGPCVNGGTCHDRVANFTCDCPAGFAGKRCEVDIDECASTPCLNEGVCVDEVNGFACDCRSTGFKGDLCQNNIDDCVSNPCVNDGNCTDLVKNYSCACHPGYSGHNCEIDVAECEAAPCRNGAECYEKSNRTIYAEDDSMRPIGFPRGPFSYSTSGGHLCICNRGFTGTNCEINIDDCGSSPCSNGECIDGIDAYECRCHKGFEGRLCEVEIDECRRYRPCALGSSCQDRIGDYFCRCPSGISGKNCTVELRGCDTNDCLHGGTCIPYLIGEEQHERNCSCIAGFYGATCQLSTTMSFGRDQNHKLMVMGSASDEYGLSFQFRTTLPDGLLAYGYGPESGFLLYLRDGTVNFLLSGDRSSANSSISMSSKEKVNDGVWWSIHLSFPNKDVTIQISNGIKNVWLNWTAPITINGVITGSRRRIYVATYVARAADQMKFEVGGFSIPNYVGCMQDVKVSGDTVVPGVESASSSSSMSATSDRSLRYMINVLQGCPRTEQCLPSTCNQGGKCLDLWTDYSCDCFRPHYGLHCEHEYEAATFNHENLTDSFAVVQIPRSERVQLRHNASVSLFIRTRSANGLIFYLGNGNLLDGAAAGDTFLAAELESGVLRTSVKINGTPESLIDKKGRRLDDGFYHLLEVSLVNRTLAAAVNNTKLFAMAVEASGDTVLDAVHLFLGGLPPPMPRNSSLILRNRRQMSFEPHSIIVGPHHTVRPSTVNFKGVMQDVRINDWPVFLFPSEDVNGGVLSRGATSPFVDDVILNEVQLGVRSDDACRIDPCRNGSNCTVTWNDYFCECPTGFRGKNCTEVEFCAFNECSSGSECRSLSDGYECIANGTFNGVNSSVVLSPHLESNVFLDSASFYFRTQTGGSVLRIRQGNSNLELLLSTNELQIGWFVNGGMKQNASLPFELIDDPLRESWHKINVSITETTLSLKVDDGQPIIGALTPLFTISQMLNKDIGTSNDDAIVEIGSGALGDTHYRGCLRELRLGEVLLPFFTRSDLRNDTSSSHFVADQIFNVELDCALCYNSECQHDSVCLDRHDSYNCNCTDGFEGQFCQVDIDECVDIVCENGGTCRDGRAAFHCQCVTGYDGLRCEHEIDECASDPCQNGGICIDLLSAYTCNCTANYTGSNCEQEKAFDCSNHPCSEGATCENVQLNHEVGYRCVCPVGRTGMLCEADIDYCAAFPCRNGATCVSQLGSYLCTCSKGYEGVDCERKIDYCASKPCYNGAECRSNDTSFECFCTSLFKGPFCKEDVNECLEGTVFCYNSGTCHNLNGGYECHCTMQFMGKHCEVVEPCYNTSLCKHGGTCHSYLFTDLGLRVTSGYNCSCPPYYEGQDCGKEVPSSGGLDSELVGIVVGSVVGATVLIVAVVLTVFLMMARKKRATRGTYSPSRQEMFGSRVELGHVMKPPPEERLI